MRARNALAIASLAIGGLLGTFLVTANAFATDTGTCKTVTTTLKDRPDSGMAGNDWALDALSRTTKICEDAPGVYSASVTDTGTFTTQAGKSPDGAADNVAGIKGYVTGGFTATFKAPGGFDGYQGKYDGESYTGSAPSSSGDWVKNVWGGQGFESVTNLVGWKWIYWTCNPDVTKATEKWVNADVAVGGNSGEITGKKCPSPSPSPSTSVPITPPAPVPTPVTGSLPVTG